MKPVGHHLDWSLTPLQLLARWPAHRRLAMLHSGRFHPRWARYCIVAEPVGSYQFVANEDGQGQGQWVGSQEASPLLGALSDKPFRDLRTLVGAAGVGIWMGQLSYDLGRWVELLPRQAINDRQWPVIELAYCPGYLVHDGESNQWHACGTWAQAMPADWLDHLDQSQSLAPYHCTEPVSTFDRQTYEATVRKALNYIAAGDVFQVNLAQRFSASFTGEYPLAQRALFHALASRSPAWFGAYLELEDRRVIASTSPELFVEVSSDGQVTTRPIKGTRPSSTDPSELEKSEKDKAELNMIVDLLRNDLGRVCSYGSVKVSQPRTIESHPTVHHGVATIIGKLHPSRDMIELLRAAMPGGSITGAPKVRAMQIIDELEPVQRGPYCGCIGYLSRDSLCLNIAIRTLLLDAAKQRVDFSVGGGIVADSDPAAEYEETLVKAKAMMQALRG